MTGGGSAINGVSHSATNYGLGNAPGDSTIKSCPYAAGFGEKPKPPAKPKPLEYCDIKQLQIVLTTEGKSKTFTIDRKRTSEPVDTKLVAKPYRGMLSSRDLVIEALADLDDTTGSAKTVTKDRKPLAIKVTATNSMSHTSFAPAHPTTTVGLAKSALAKSDGGAPVNGQYLAPNPGGMGNTFWGQIWPFGADRTRTYDLIGHACGTPPIPRVAIAQLSAKLVVMPYEEWQITIGFKGTREGSYSKEANKYDAQDGKSSRTVRETTITKSRVGNVETGTTTQTMTTASGHGRVREKETTTTLDYTLLSAKSTTVTSIENSWDKKKRTETDDDADFRKVSIKHLIGGQEVECEVSDTIKKIIEIKKIFDDAKKLFDSVKIGWSISFSYELFGGNISFAWGNRWPAAYVEDHRVYYVERFVKVGGQLDVVSGSVTGFFGFKVDPWWAPVAVEVGAYLTASIKVSLAASITRSYTNPVLAGKSTSGSFDPSATIGFELGAKANGRAFGYSVESKFAIEAGASLTFQGAISTEHSPYLKGSLIIGKEHKGTGPGAPKADAIRLIGELVCTGETIRRREIDPIVLVKGTEVFKDKYFWGEAPAGG